MEHLPLKRPQFFFTSQPQPCPYLADRIERKIVTELTGPDAADLHEALARAGFRRSHAIAYMPACPGCSACIAVRIPVAEFRPSRTMRRIIKANADLTARMVPALSTHEHYALFARYQKQRHTGGDMALMEYHEYRSMVEDSPIDTYLAEFRDGGGHLAGVTLIDQTSDGLSAVYSFFDPDQVARSLGTHAVLWLIGEARRRHLPYIYLGYWVAESPKMSYKIRYQPLEAFGPDGWRRITGR